MVTAKIDVSMKQPRDNEAHFLQITKLTQDNGEDNGIGKKWKYDQSPFLYISLQRLD